LLVAKKNVTAFCHQKMSLKWVVENILARVARDCLTSSHSYQNCCVCCCKFQIGDKPIKSPIEISTKFQRKNVVNLVAKRFANSANKIAKIHGRTSLQIVM
jgi:hypothetical protein